MPDAFVEEIRSKIATLHEGDEDQLRVVFSDCPRIIVEAPAGYGKTTTMISRIAYLFATGRIPNPKRILGLTFSVNAALKVKREVAEKLPTLIKTRNSPVAIGEKATVTNYHGFCKGIIKKYGYLLSPSLRKDINLFRAVGDSEISNIDSLRTVIAPNELQYLINVESAIKKNHIPNKQTIQQYNEIVILNLLPLDYVTHNAIILFVLQLFSIYKEIQRFYQSYYALIIVDEFQDTNCIAQLLLDAIISDQTQLLFLGDPLQRIYGFIGAIPDIMSSSINRYSMSRVTLSKNYRFRSNAEMLKLDRNIRANAASGFMPNISAEDVAMLPGFWGINQHDEVSQITEKVQALLNDSTTKVALLFRSRGKNTELAEQELIARHVPFFYGLFTDDDEEYIRFHIQCQEEFIRHFGQKKTIHCKALHSFSESMKTLYVADNKKTTSSLLKLLDALVKKVSIDYVDLTPEDKYALMLDIFENRQLKQAMEYVDTQVILSTVHGAKGLEWDYVILGDVERWVFPSYSACSHCDNKFSSPEKCRCTLPTPVSVDLVEAALDELSVFYVGITRAKKQVYVSASATRLDFYGKEKTSVFSCLVGMKGIKLVKAS